MKAVIRLRGLHEAMAWAMVRKRRFSMPANVLAKTVQEMGFHRVAGGRPLNAADVVGRARSGGYSNMFTVTGQGDRAVIHLRNSYSRAE